MYCKCFNSELQGIYDDETNLTNEVFSGLLNDTNKLCDVYFNVENNLIGAHKCILAARLQNCETILESKKEYPIIIKNITYRAFKLFLKYLYTNTLDEVIFTPELLCEILSLSLEYDTVCLKKICMNNFNNFLESKLIF